MIKSVEIENLRGIQQGKLDNLTRLVVLVGPNGCGKSTVLDAINIGASSDVLLAIQQSINRVPLELGKGRWLLYRGGGAAQIRIASTDTTRTWRFKNDPTQAQNPIRISYADSNHPNQIPIANLDQDGGTSREQNHPPAGLAGVTSVGFPTFEGNQTLHDLYSNVATRGKKESAREVISTLLPGLKQIELLTDRGRPYLSLDYGTHAVPAELAGDGLRYLLRTILYLASPSHSTILLEEPEVHLHPGAIWQMASTIVAVVAAETQVVLSTHSLELIDALVEHCEKQGQLDQLQVVRMQLVDGCLRTVQVDGPTVASVRENIGDDLR